MKYHGGRRDQCLKKVKEIKTQNIQDNKRQELATNILEHFREN